MFKFIYNALVRYQSSITYEMHHGTVDQVKTQYKYGENRTYGISGRYYVVLNTIEPQNLRTVFPMFVY